MSWPERVGRVTRSAARRKPAAEPERSAEESRTVLLRRLQKLRSRAQATAAELEESTIAGGDEQEYLDFIAQLGPEELRHPDVAYLAQRQDLVAADSFWRSLIIRRRRKQLGTLPEHFLGITKEWDRDFVTRLGVRTAAVLYEGPYEGVREHVRPGTVVKPMRAYGSAGAFFVFDFDHIVGIARSTPLDSLDAMFDFAEKELEAYGRSHDQLWQVQELVLGPDGTPARDLKFYAFYGQIGMIVEIARHPERAYGYFSGASLRPIRAGGKARPAFADLKDTIVAGGGVSEAMFDEVRALSKAIPVPFMRIDYHYGSDELVFCEFSSAPGGSHQLPKRFDQVLGRLYHEAEIELTGDLLGGKTFETWQAFQAGQFERLARASEQRRALRQVKG